MLRRVRGARKGPGTRTIHSSFPNVICGDGAAVAAVHLISLSLVSPDDPGLTIPASRVYSLPFERENEGLTTPGADLLLPSLEAQTLYSFTSRSLPLPGHDVDVRESGELTRTRIVTERQTSELREAHS